MQYGFVIDHESCIGCHACTVACKAENNVPVGNFRTWVKYTEVGEFPDIRRQFLVQRCNHCTKAPCVTICPVNALEKRKDGIVDIDRDACIGCRACMQACPYDAIYLNEDLGAVEKCHFCAHRVEKNLEPACVIVCPVGAIIPGDFHDPTSRVSLLVKNKPMKMRRTEQGTGPNVRYIGVSDVVLNPGQASRPSTYLSSDRPPHKPEMWPEAAVPTQKDARVVLDAGHRVEWGWGVVMYLVTKGIAGGAAMLAPFAALLGLTGFARDYLPELMALVFIGITGALLVEDLKKPLAFIRLFTRPNWKSWLVKGAWVINAFIALMIASIALRWFGMNGAADAVRWFGAAAGAAVAGYTAFLFAQCEGRDLWQSKLLLPQLLIQAVFCGCVALLPFIQSSWDIGWQHRPSLLCWIFPISLFLMAALAHWEYVRLHHTENARQAAGFLRTVRFGRWPAMWTALALLVISLALLNQFPAFTFVPALAALFIYEFAFIRAGQLPPLS